MKARLFECETRFGAERTGVETGKSRVVFDFYGDYKTQFMKRDGQWVTGMGFKWSEDFTEPRYLDAPPQRLPVSELKNYVGKVIVFPWCGSWRLEEVVEVDCETMRLKNLPGRYIISEIIDWFCEFTPPPEPTPPPKFPEIRKFRCVALDQSPRVGIFCGGRYQLLNDDGTLFGCHLSRETFDDGYTDLQWEDGE